MSYLYNDLIFNTSTIISKNRSQRPAVGNNHQICPFCYENQHMIEKIWAVIPIEDDELRIINNKYPVSSETLPGIHDVVVETKYHNKQIYELSLRHWEVVLEALAMRWKQLVEEHEMSFIQIFKNNGMKAGASIAHAHWQIIALKDTPYTMEKQYKDFEQHTKQKGCLCCQAVEERIPMGYSIFETKCWKVIAPFNASYQYETWLIVKTHYPHFGALDSNVLKDLSYVMKKVSYIYHKILPGVDYNICVMSGRQGKDEDYHLIIKYIPRMGGLAGFELATKCHINAVEPKEQAREMQVYVNNTDEGGRR